MEVICEFWCSPLRKEIYSETYIALDTEDLYLSDEIKNSYIDCYGDFWQDVFGEESDSVGGLWKVVCQIGISWENSYDYEGIPDTEAVFNTDTIFKSKCTSLTDLKWRWLDLTGRTQEYFDKVIDKQNKLFSEAAANE